MGINKFKIGHLYHFKTVVLNNEEFIFKVLDLKEGYVEMKIIKNIKCSNKYTGFSFDSAIYNLSVNVKYDYGFSKELEEFLNDQSS